MGVIMRIIYYTIKNTKANTNYMQIDKNDTDFLIESIISMQSYMGELSLCPNKDVRELLNWYTKSNKKLPFHKGWKKHNSPQTFISGILNNIMFGSQYDLTEVQASHIQEILNMYSDLINALKPLDISLQTREQDCIMFSENLWTRQ